MINDLCHSLRRHLRGAGATASRRNGEPDAHARRPAAATGPPAGSPPAPAAAPSNRVLSAVTRYDFRTRALRGHKVHPVAANLFDHLIHALIRTDQASHHDKLRISRRSVRLHLRRLQMLAERLAVHHVQRCILRRVRNFDATACVQPSKRRPRAEESNESSACSAFCTRTSPSRFSGRTTRKSNAVAGQPDSVSLTDGHPWPKRIQVDSAACHQRREPPGSPAVDSARPPTRSARIQTSHPHQQSGRTARAAGAPLSPRR